MKRTGLALMALLLVTTLSGCNTARGFGEDVQKLGSTITHSAG